MLRSLSMKVSYDATFTAGLHCDKQFFSQLQYTCMSFKIPCQYIFVQFTMIRNVQQSLIDSK